VVASDVSAAAGSSAAKVEVPIVAAYCVPKASLPISCDVIGNSIDRYPRQPCRAELLGVDVGDPAELPKLGGLDGCDRPIHRRIHVEERLADVDRPTGSDGHAIDVEGGGERIAADLLCLNRGETDGTQQHLQAGRRRHGRSGLLTIPPPSARIANDEVLHIAQRVVADLIGRQY
jgi:hypothetical protein